MRDWIIVAGLAFLALGCGEEAGAGDTGGGTAGETAEGTDAASGEDASAGDAPGGAEADADLAEVEPAGDAAPIGADEGDAVAPGVPVVAIDPTVILFDTVSAGLSAQETFVISSTGSEALVVDRMDFTGPAVFSVSLPDLPGSGPWTPGETITFAPPLTIPPGGSRTVQVTFSPVDAQPVSAALWVHTNDPAKPKGIKVLLEATQGYPCVQVTPTHVGFGGVVVGAKGVREVTLKSCGGAPLEVTGIALGAGGSSAYALSFSELPGGVAPSPAAPLVLDPGHSKTIAVEYAPAAVSPIGEDGKPVLDEATLVVSSNAPESTVDVSLAGLGTDEACPTAVLDIEEGESVIPVTTLHLHGGQSYAPGGATVATWAWSATQPAGSVSTFQPNNGAQNPTFECDVVGEYAFRLEVWDDTGTKSCVPAEATVVVVPDAAIYVELLWQTPADAVQSDSGEDAGADVDLHFAHEANATSGVDVDGDGAADPWFDVKYDCFWFNAHPDWGSAGLALDDPSLVRDDEDGAGPEAVSVTAPEAATYRIGVHYWHDHSYGASFVTLRIYIYGLLVYEAEDAEMQRYDLWDAAVLTWPGGDVTPVKAEEGGYDISSFKHPYW